MILGVSIIYSRPITLKLCSHLKVNYEYQTAYTFCHHSQHRHRSKV